jgi:phage baseplate assembly protein W
MDFLGRSLAFPPRPDGKGGLALVSGVAAVEDSLRAIITSLKGSHVLEYWLGLPSFVFDPIADPAAVSELVREAILNAEDRVDPETLRVDVGTGNASDFDQGYMPITVTYSVLGEATMRTLETGFRTVP